MFEAATRLPLRLVMTGMQQLRKLNWFVRRPQVRGAHAVPVTPEGRIVLVRLRYAKGWRLPGGGAKDVETLEEAALREMREEIGMTAHGQVRVVCEEEQVIDFKQDCSTIFIVRDVAYAPRWSLEIEEVAEFPPGALPDGLSPQTRRWLDQIRPALP